MDPYTIIDEIDETLLTKAHNMIDEYEELYPDKFLKYWMMYQIGETVWAIINMFDIPKKVK